MSFDQTFLDIRQKLSLSLFSNEAAVSSEIVLTVLQALGWPTQDPSIVTHEHSVEGRRVDFALCHPANRPVIFIEVKPVGAAARAERQLFECAFHEGVPIAVLTDGRTWNFYLPAGQGSYAERCITHVDLLDDPVESIVSRMLRYLRYEAVWRNEATMNAHNDYQSLRSRREAKRSIPTAWERIASNPSAKLIELLCDETEEICGFKADPQDALDFLKDRNHTPAKSSASETPTKIKQPSRVEVIQKQTKSGRTYICQIEFSSLLGTFDTNHEALTWFLNELERKNKGFLQHFANNKPSSMRVRSIIASSPSGLFSGQPLEFAERHAHDMKNGWYLNKNENTERFESWVELACKVASIDLRQEVNVTIANRG